MEALAASRPASSETANGNVSSGEGNLRATGESKIENDLETQAEQSVMEVLSLGTERAGFEPAMGFKPHTAFPVLLLRPLGHLSKIEREVYSNAHPLTSGGSGTSRVIAIARNNSASAMFTSPSAVTV
jgi:hypothetical protein